MLPSTTTGPSAKRSPSLRTFELADDRYDEFLARVMGHFEATVAESPHLFVTNALRLWDVYLDAAPRSLRAERTCNACRRFIETYGGLVTIDENGYARSAMWPSGPSSLGLELPPAYAAASRAMQSAVAGAHVVGVFRSSLPVWGQPITRVDRAKTPSGVFHHVAVVPPAAIRWTGVTQTAEQWMAEKLQEQGMLVQSLHDFRIEDVRKAHALLSQGQVFRSEKHEGMAKWLLDLQERWVDNRGNKRAGANLIWRAVAEAPPGWCHVRSGMLDRSSRTSPPSA